MRIILSLKIVHQSASIYKQCQILLNNIKWLFIVTILYEQENRWRTNVIINNTYCAIYQYFDTKLVNGVFIGPGDGYAIWCLIVTQGHCHGVGNMYISHLMDGMQTFMEINDL